MSIFRDLLLSAVTLPPREVDDLIEALIALQDARAGDPDAEPDFDDEPDADEYKLVPFRGCDPGEIGGDRAVLESWIFHHDEDAEPDADREPCEAGEDRGTIADGDYRARELVRAARRDTRYLVDRLRWDRRSAAA